MADRPLLTRRSLLLAKVETTYNEDSNPTAANDALLVSEPAYTIDPNVLERDYVRASLSPTPVRIGRKLAGMTFTVELRSNGDTDSGQDADRAKLGVLLRGCAFREVLARGTETIGAVKNIGNPSQAVSWASSRANNSKELREYRIGVVAGGASGTATARVYEATGRDTTVLKHSKFSATTDSAAGTLAWSNLNTDAPRLTAAGTWTTGDKINLDIGGFTAEVTVGSTSTATGVASSIVAAIGTSGNEVLHDNISAANAAGVVTITMESGTRVAAVTLTSGNNVDLGNSNARVAPTWTGSLAGRSATEGDVLGDQWKLFVFPRGFRYEPRSEDFESLTLYAYFDGILHKLTGAFGTFTINAEAGAFGTVDFEFTGQYIKPEDQPVPSGAIYESTPPPILQKAQFSVDGVSLVANSMTYTQGNEIAPRPDLNSADGYNGVRVTGRTPEGGIDPETTLVASFDFWDRLAEAAQFPVIMRAGEEDGNMVWFGAPEAGYTGLTYADREGIRTYDAGLRFTATTEDDETIICIA